VNRNDIIMEMGIPEFCLVFGNDIKKAGGEINKQKY